MSGSPTCDTENKTEKLSEANLKLRHALRAGGVINTKTSRDKIKANQMDFIKTKCKQRNVNRIA